LSRDSPSSPSQSTLRAQALADFFVEKVSNVRAAIQQCAPQTFLGPCPAHLSDFLLCTPAQVHQTILQSARKSCHLDPVPHTRVIALLHLVLPFLHLLCNKLLQSGVLPDEEKLAAVTPILKKTALNHDIASSFRPVSNLTYVSKLIEHLAYSQLMTYQQSHSLLSPVQSAFRPYHSHSTETATLKVVSDVSDAADAGQYTILALFDLSAAFDTIDHNTLLHRLSFTYGIGGTVLRCIESFLTGRYVVVYFADQQST
jgi:hypothetical protein